MSGDVPLLRIIEGGKLMEMDLNDLLFPKEMHAEYSKEKFTQFRSAVPNEWKIDQAPEDTHMNVIVKVVDGKAKLTIKSTAEADAYFGTSVNEGVATLATSQDGILAETQRQFQGHVAMPPLAKEIKRYGSGKKLLQTFPFWLDTHSDIPLFRNLDTLNRLVCWHFDQLDAELKLRTEGIKKDLGIDTKLPLKALKQHEKFEEFKSKADAVVGPLNDNDKEQYFNTNSWNDTLLPDSWIMCVLNYCIVRRYVNQFYTFCQVAGNKGTELKPSEFKFVMNNWKPKTA